MINIYSCQSATIDRYDCVITNYYCTVRPHKRGKTQILFNKGMVNVVTYIYVHVRYMTVVGAVLIRFD